VTRLFLSLLGIVARSPGNGRRGSGVRLRLRPGPEGLSRRLRCGDAGRVLLVFGRLRRFASIIQQFPHQIVGQPILRIVIQSGGQGNAGPFAVALKHVHVP